MLNLGCVLQLLGSSKGNRELLSTHKTATTTGPAWWCGQNFYNSLDPFRTSTFKDPRSRLKTIFPRIKHAQFSQKGGDKTRITCCVPNPSVELFIVVEVKIEHFSLTGDEVVCQTAASLKTQ